MDNENKIRCGWCSASDLYKKYHDEEWGVPVYDDPSLFEFLILETFQAGLSWITILNKRENFRVAFDHFNYLVVLPCVQIRLVHAYGNLKVVVFTKNQESVK